MKCLRLTVLNALLAALRPNSKAHGGLTPRRSPKCF